jgi:peptidoglycan/LPS O-acetylase OafA/YrhL
MLFHIYPFIYPHAIHIPGTKVEIHWLATGGSVGVWILYALCAFLLARPFLWAQQPPSAAQVTNYFARRAWRILPPLWVQIAILVLIAHATSSSQPTFRDVLPYALLIQNLWPSPAPALNGVWWTLPVEFNFYVVLPVLSLAIFAVLKRRRVATCFIVIALGLLLEFFWRQFCVHHYGPTRLPELVIAAGQLPGVLSSFLAGLVCAAFADPATPTQPSPRKADAFFVSGIMLVLLAMWVGHLNFQTYWSGSLMYYASSPVTALGSALLIWGCFTGSRVARQLLANRLVHASGIVSYSLYLWHQPIIEWWARAFSNNTTEGHRAWLFALVVIVTTLAVSTLSYWLVERPSMRAMSRLRKNTTPRIQAA